MSLSLLLGFRKELDDLLDMTIQAPLNLPLANLTLRGIHLIDFTGRCLLHPL